MRRFTNEHCAVSFVSTAARKPLNRKAKRTVVRQRQAGEVILVEVRFQETKGHREKRSSRTLDGVVWASAGGIGIKHVTASSSSNIYSRRRHVQAAAVPVATPTGTAAATSAHAKASLHGELGD